MRELLDTWYKQKAAIEADPYDGDAVQAWGMAFAFLYFDSEDALCALCGIDPTEFSYIHKFQVIEKLEATYGT